MTEKLHFVACGVLFDPTSQIEVCVNSLGRDRTGFCSLISCWQMSESDSMVRGQLPYGLEAEELNPGIFKTCLHTDLPIPLTKLSLQYESL